MHEFESATGNIAFANAEDFERLLLDTVVLTNSSGSAMKFRELLQ